MSETKSDRAHVSDEGVIIHVLYRTGPKRKTKGKENLLLVPWSQRSFLWGGVNPCRPDVSMLLALENKRQYFEEDHCVMPKLRRLPRASVVWDVTNKKIVSLSHYTRVYVTNMSASCFCFFYANTPLSKKERSGDRLIETPPPPPPPPPPPLILGQCLGTGVPLTLT